MPAIVSVSRKSNIFNNYLNRIKKNLSANKHTLRVGYLDPDTAYIATIQEYGVSITVTDKMRNWFAREHAVYLKDETTEIVIPPRPFMQQTVDKFEKTWIKLFIQYAKEFDYDIYAVLDKLGLVVMSNIKETITSGTFEPNAALTIKLKGKDNPLIDTGHMLNSVAMEITE